MCIRNQKNPVQPPPFFFSMTQENAPNKVIEGKIKRTFAVSFCWTTCDFLRFHWTQMVVCLDALFKGAEEPPLPFLEEQHPDDVVLPTTDSASNGSCDFQSAEAIRDVAEIDMYLGPGPELIAQMFWSLAPKSLLASVSHTRLPLTGRRMFPSVMLLFPNALVLKQYVLAFRERGPSHCVNLRSDDAPKLMPLTFDQLHSWRSAYPQSVARAAIDDVPTFIVVASVIHIRNPPNRPVSATSACRAVYTYACTGIIIPANRTASVQSPQAAKIDVSPVASDTAKSCRTCAKTASFKLCSRCQIARYCSRECQLQDWPTHKQTCLPKAT